MANDTYKLIGFEEEGRSVNLMIKGTGKVLSMGVEEILRSKIIEKLEANEVKEICKKAYGKNAPNRCKEDQKETKREEHNEGYWLIYAFISAALCSLFILSNVVGVKPISISFFSLEMIVPIAIFIYPISFILVDILNEFYGLKLARRQPF